jgi:hypothetical protein
MIEVLQFRSQTRETFTLFAYEEMVSSSGLNTWWNKHVDNKFSAHDAILE